MDSHLNGGDPRTYKKTEGSNTTNANDRSTINPNMQSSNHANAINPGPHQANASTSTASNDSASINTTPNNHEHKF